MMYNFKTAVQEWSNLPFDGVGYIKSEHILKLKKQDVLAFISQFEKTRYDKKGWRNHNNLWRSTLGLDTTEGKTIIDFGSGFGIESLQFLYKGNEIILADICEENLQAAEYIINCAGFSVKEKVLITYEEPFFETKNKYDIFYSNGVLHHTPKMMQILEQAKLGFTSLKTAEYRLMLYSDKAWEIEAGRPINRDKPIHKQKGFYRYVRIMDSVGSYADWYDERKIKEQLPEGIALKEYNYIGERLRYSTAILGIC